MKLPLKASLCLLIAAQLMACGASSGFGAQPTMRTARHVRAHGAGFQFPGGQVAPDKALDTAFNLDAEGEGVLDLTAHVPGADWELVGREAATVRLSVDGVYNQDVVLNLGEQTHTYRLALGAVKPGIHTLRIERLKDFSAPGLTEIDVEGGQVSVVTPDAPNYDAYAFAPILMSRPTPHLTDTPLLMYYERHAMPDGRNWLRYTPMWSNEDGGTATRALMARWGRTVDIDWAYNVYRNAQNQPEQETYQAWLHFTRKFKGKHEGHHPFMQVASKNNIYSDELEGPLRFRPAPYEELDPTKTAREEMLDRNPWAYTLMVKELFRERKSARDFFNPPQLEDGAIGDPRRFLFVEFKQDSDGRGVAAAVKLKSMPDVFCSNRGDKGLQAERNGWCRVAIELPRRVTMDDIERIDLVGLGHGNAVVREVRKVMVLDDRFQPVFFPITWEGEGALRRDEDRVTVYGIAPIPPANKPQ
jgi:hypothetical protein